MPLKSNTPATKPEPGRRGEGPGAGPKLLSALVLALLGGALPAAAVGKEVFVCQELKAVVANAAQGFAAYKGSVDPNHPPSQGFGTAYRAKKALTGADACRVVETRLDEPKMRVVQSAYSCQFGKVFQLSKALRAELTRCAAGEVDDPADPNELSIWTDRVASGEGYRGTEVNAQVNAATGLTLLVSQAVCTNKGNTPACDD